ILPSPRASSIAASPAPTALSPAHPYPFTVSPQIPSAASFGTSWNGNSPRSQQSAMIGMTSASENARTRSRTSRSSSVSRTSRPKRSWYKVERASLTDSPLPGRHPDGTVETYYLAVEHLLLDDAWGYRDHSYTARGKFAGHRERERNDATLRSSVGGLPDLAVVGSDARGIDNDPALAFL